jgi:hypothetical protein
MRASAPALAPFTRIVGATRNNSLIHPNQFYGPYPYYSGERGPPPLVYRTNQRELTLPPLPIYTPPPPLVIVVVGLRDSTAVLGDRIQTCHYYRVKSLVILDQSNKPSINNLFGGSRQPAGHWEGVRRALSVWCLPSAPPFP